MYTGLMNIPVGYGQLLFSYSGVGTVYPMAWTIGFQNAGNLTAQEAADVAVVAFFDNLNSQTVDDLLMNEVLAKLGPNSTGPSATAINSSPGTKVGTGVSPNVSWLIQKRTNLGGRQGRGRFYLPGLTEAEVNSDGSIDAGQVSAMSGALGDFFADLNSGGIPPVLLHSTALAPTPITVLNPDNRVATQRRRLRR